MTPLHFAQDRRIFLLLLLSLVALLSLGIRARPGVGSTQYRSTGSNRFGYRYGNIWMANAGYEHKLGQERSRGLSSEAIRTRDR